MIPIRFKPKFRSIDDIMHDIGFISVTRGWVLPKAKIKSSKSVQYHVVATSQGYDLHADYDVGGKHKIERLYQRDDVFLKILEAVDRGETPTVTQKMKNKYNTLKLPTK